MDENGEGLRVEAPEGSSGKKAVELGSEAVLEFLRDTQVRCWSLAGVARAPRAEQVGGGEGRRRGGPGPP